jgi:hypothetical protein
MQSILLFLLFSCNVYLTYSTSARIYWTTLVTCAGITDGRLPDRLSPSTNTRPSTEHLCHLKTILHDTELVPLALLRFFVGICWCFTNTSAKFNDRRIHRRLATDIFTY